MFGRLFFDNDLMNFLQVSSNSKISMILLNGGMNAICEEGNFIKRDREEIDILNFIPKGKIIVGDDSSIDTFFSQNSNRTRIKVGRFVRKFVSKQSFVDFSITDKDIEDFVNLFKSYFTPNKENLKIVEGEEILKWYLEENYATTCDLRTGSLWKSCMRQPERNKFMDIYAKNISLCKMLIFLNDDGKLRARALLWEGVSDKNGNVYRVMDRIYTIYDHDTFLFKSWAKENGYIMKLEQSSKSESLFDVGGQPMNIELKIKLGKWDLNHYPYLDTFKYFDLYGGYLSNTPNFVHQYKLVQSDGSVEREERLLSEDDYDEGEYDEGEHDDGW